MLKNKPMPSNPQPKGAYQFARIGDISLRTRLIVVITLTTSIAVIALGYFNFSRAQQTQTFLQDQLQVTVRQQAESQLQNKALVAATQADQYLSSISDDLQEEASYFVNVLNKEDLFSSGAYSDARQKLSRLSDGQWDNPNTDPSAILVPSSVGLDNEEVAKINTFLYLDFFAPNLLKKNNNVIATYFIDTDGVTIYYPNIDLAHVVGNFKATNESFYQIATPENNPQRLSVWTTPYQDPAKTGLIVTNSFPIYDESDKFRGIMGVDIRLSTIANQITGIKVGSNGYTFLIDSTGHILVLPEKGYSDFAIIAMDIPVNEPIKQSILGAGTEELQNITKTMTAGRSGIATATINGKEHYVAYALLKSVGYSLGIVVPSAELNAPFFIASSELDNQTRNTINISLILIVIILIATVIVSWAIGRQLTNPLIALTTSAQKIAAGDFLVEARANSDDEIGTLGKAFNNMTAQLRDSISNLETRVADRTHEISIVNEKYQHQAIQLRAVAEIARSAASLKRLDDLLPEITQRISAAFGFYHIGIFLLDVNREYAVLKASNSVGGQRMLLRNHRLKVGEMGIVGFVTQTGQSRIALNVGEDAVYFNNIDLPETHSELALPLSIGNEIIGALDVQSTQTAAFTNQDVDTLGLLADQVSIAIQNARLFDETRTALQEAQNIYTQSALVSWREINRQSTISGFRYANGTVEALNTDTISQAASIDSVIPAPSSASPGKSNFETSKETISIPINSRGQSLGTLNIRQPGRTLAWRDSEIHLYQSIVERLSFALENARLYIDAQKRASKELLIGEIGAKISSSVNLDNILQIVVEELGRTHPGSEVIVQFEKSNLVTSTESGGDL